MKYEFEECLKDVSEHKQLRYYNIKANIKHMGREQLERLALLNYTMYALADNRYKLITEQLPPIKPEIEREIPF